MASNQHKKHADGKSQLNLAKATAKEGGTGTPATPGDNRGAEDIDGNKAGAKGGNKAPGPDEPAPPIPSDGQRKPKD